MAKRLASCIAAALLGSSCSFLYGANISVERAQDAPSFSQQEQETARDLVLEVGRAAGLWETDAAEKLSATPSSSPYEHFVSLGAPGGENPDLRSVVVLGGVRNDRREIRISVSDHARGEPLPSTREMVEDLRTALERAFPDSRVDVAAHRVRRGFAP